LSLPSDHEFWNVVVPRAREQLRALLASHPITARERANRQGMLGSLLLDWVSTDGQRVLSVHLLEPDEPFAVDHFFKTLAADPQPRELSLSLREPAEYVSLIVDCIERWLVRGADEAELDALLERHEA